MTPKKIEIEVKDLSERVKKKEKEVDDLRLLNKVLQVAVDLQKKVKNRKSEQ